MTDQIKPPSWAKFCGGKWYRWFVFYEWGAEWILYAFNRIALIKLLVNGVVATSIVAGVAMFYFDYGDRKTDRAVRRATMLATMVQVAAATKDEEIQNSVVPILEIMVRDGMDLSGLPLPGVNLSRAILSDANLNEANLAGAYLIGADLNNAYLIGADLIGANLSWADLNNAYLFGANLSGADLSWADIGKTTITRSNINETSLTQGHLDSACIDKGDPPINLPDGLTPPTKICGE